MAVRHVVSVKMYVQDMSDYVQLNNQYIRHFSVNPPVRVCVEVGSAGVGRGKGIGLGRWEWKMGREMGLWEWGRGMGDGYLVLYLGCNVSPFICVSSACFPSCFFLYISIF